MRSELSAPNITYEMPELIGGEKEMVEENLTFFYDSLKIEKRNKEVLDTYL